MSIHFFPNDSEYDPLIRDCLVTVNEGNFMNIDNKRSMLALLAVAVSAFAIRTTEFKQVDDS
ncbi:hypothetical protein [Paenibacillus antarcticus]|uniref:hypothetical protein n=1 Tax=Paenibacillus antarcticus TaxID=253703 RepID=UPI000B12EA2B|nr:hypothetical protein [Paenibacillus antarcticus]